MFWRILRKSLLTRKNHFAVAVIAVTMGALLVSATSTISLNIKDKISRELRAYGPNMSILPISSAIGVENGAVLASTAYLMQDHLNSLRNDKEILEVSPVLEGSAKIDSQSIRIIGLEWSAAMKIHPWWELKGRAPTKDGVVVGQALAKQIGLAIDQPIKVINGQTMINTKISGIVQTGAEEDNQLLLDLDTAQELSGLKGKISRIDVSILSTKTSIEEKGAQLETLVPGSRAKVIQQVAHAEQRLLEKIQALMYFVTLGVLIVSLLSIAGTMTTTVIQRRKEIGIMKAIGASNREVAKLFLTEATVFGSIGGTLGLITGFGLAEAIGISVFSTTVVLPPVVVPLTLGAACVVTWLASARPVLQAVSIEPAVTLRGE